MQINNSVIEGLLAILQHIARHHQVALEEVTAIRGIAYPIVPRSIIQQRPATHYPSEIQWDVSAQIVLVTHDRIC